MGTTQHIQTPTISHLSLTCTYTHLVPHTSHTYTARLAHPHTQYYSIGGMYIITCSRARPQIQIDTAPDIEQYQSVVTKLHVSTHALWGDIFSAVYMCR